MERQVLHWSQEGTSLEPGGGTCVGVVIVGGNRGTSSEILILYKCLEAKKLATIVILRGKVRRRRRGMMTGEWGELIPTHPRMSLMRRR